MAAALKSQALARGGIAFARALAPVMRSLLACCDSMGMLAGD
ncbi:hypothetical protein ACGLHS_15365 [Variovorax sp. VaC1]